MFRSRSRRCFLILVALLCIVSARSPVLAQTAQARKDSLAQLRVTIKEFQARIAVADSIGDAREGVRQRIMLAPLVKRSQAVELYEQAALIADSAGLFEDEELRARQGLMEVHQTSGNWRKAYEEADRVIELTQRIAERTEKARISEREAFETTITERDRSARGAELVLEDAQFRASGMKTIAERWVMIAFCTALVLLCIIALLLVLGARRRKALRTEIDALRADIAELKAPRNRMREAAIEEAAPPLPVVRIPDEPPAADTAAMDEALLALFRKRAPERLATLRDARERGDEEKVTRVVHTLKPQLIALDESGSGALCLRITGAEAQQDMQRWNADIDALERSIERLLA